MIQCDHFFDPEAGMRGEGAHNARVSDQHDINATFPTLEEVSASLATTWNEKHPGEPVAEDGSDFEFDDVQPW